MSNYLVDVKDFGAVGDGITSDTGAFNAAIQDATLHGGKVVAAGCFKITGYMTVTASCDFSGACFVIDQAVINVTHTADYLSNPETTLTIPNRDLDKSGLTELSTSLKGVINPRLIKEFENAFVSIQTLSEEIYIYRSGTSGQKRSTVSLMQKYGRLAYPLNHDYDAISDVQIKLRKLPNSRLTFNSPRFEILRFASDDSPAKGPLLSISRDLVTVYNLSINHTERTPVPANAYYALTRVADCYDVHFIDTSFPGYGVTNSEPGEAEIVKYDHILQTALKVRFDGLNASTGWKTIDGNSSRDISIHDSNLYGFHGHFNVADVLLENCRLYTGGISIGTGAPGSSLTVRNCYFQSVFGGAVSMRPDYGELRGNVLIENCHLEMTDLTLDSQLECTILSLVDNAITGHTQPGRYALPENITIQNITINCKHNCNIIKLNNNNYTYSNDQRLDAPKNVTLANITMNSVHHGELIFEYRFVPYNHATAAPVQYSITRCRNESALVRFHFWGSPNNNADTLQYVLDIDNVANAALLLVAGRRSEVTLRNSACVVLDTYNGGYAYLKKLSVDHCTFLFDEHYSDSQTFSISHNNLINLFTHCIFDAEQYHKNTGMSLSIPAVAHSTVGNIGIHCHGISPANNRAGSSAIVPLIGSGNTYERVNGSLKPV